MDIKAVIITLLRDGFILVFNQDKLDIVKTAEALQAAGVNNMEVTCRVSKPLEKLARLRRDLRIRTILCPPWRGWSKPGRVISFRPSTSATTVSVNSPAGWP
jgi:uncharacterized membrane protein